MITTPKKVLLVIVFVLLNTMPSLALEERLIASDGDTRHRFGLSVEIDSTMILVGAPGALSDGDYRGAVYIYEYEHSTLEWLETQKLEMTDEGPLDLFGSSIAKGEIFKLAVKTPEGISHGSVVRYMASQRVYL